jgi:hypothetical protein
MMRSCEALNLVDEKHQQWASNFVSGEDHAETRAKKFAIWSAWVVHFRHYLYDRFRVNPLPEDEEVKEEEAEY